MEVRRDGAAGAELLRAIREGDLDALARLLGEHPGLAAARIADGRGGSMTPLHAATDWPGHFPNGADVVRLLLREGADPDAPVAGSWHAETPLHWAASSDDLEVADALIDGGADIEARGGSIGGGTPLDNAVGYGQWQVAHRLVARGARVRALWHAAALGMTGRLMDLLATEPRPGPDQINQAFWHACAGGQPRTAACLLARGADVNWIPDYARKSALDAAGSLETRRQVLVDLLRRHGARPRPEAPPESRQA